MPGPILTDLAIEATPSTTSSNLLCWTYRRDPATQHCPWLKKIALAAPSMAFGPGVVENDVGALAAELQGQLLQVAGPGGRDDQLADLGGTGEGDLVDVPVRRQRRARGLAVARND